MAADSPHLPETDSDRKQGGKEAAGAESGKDMNLAGLGLQLTGAVLLFVAIGWWLDTKLGTSPWAIVVCAMLGLVAGLYRFVRDAMK